MNPRLLVTLVLILSFVPVALAGTEIPDANKTSTVSPPASLVGGYIQEHVKELNSTVVSEQNQAREALVAGALCKTAGSSPSPAYLSSYSTAMNTAMVTLAKDNSASLRTRLAGAMVTSRVADLAKNTALIPAAVAFMTDPADAVALWGTKSAYSMLPAELGVNAKNSVLVPALVRVVKDHPNSGPIASEVFAALSLDLFTSPDAVNSQMLSAVIPAVQSVIALRVVSYQSGIPDEPVADRTGISILVNSKAWASQNAESKLQTVQLLSDLLSLAGQQATANGQDGVERLHTVIQRVYSSINAVAQYADVASPSLQDAVRPLKDITRSSQASSLLPKIDVVYPAIVAVPQFTKVTAPPKITSSTSRPVPAGSSVPSNPVK